MRLERYERILKENIRLQAQISAEVNSFTYELYDHDLKSLQDKHWLNDAIIFVYLNYLLDENGLKKAFVFDPLMLVTMQQQRYVSKEILFTWIKPGKVDKMQILIFPLLVSSHWFLALAINVEACWYFFLLNSMQSDDDLDHFLLLHEITRQLVGCNDFKAEFNICDVPQQKNSYDCGIFLLHFAEIILSKSNILVILFLILGFSSNMR